MKAIWVSAALLAVIPCFGQTAAELLQKGVYAQETEGNLDNAILIYRQIVNSAPSQRDVAAQAQYRLAQALLQKGNLTEASREFERLARDYADYGSLVSSLAGQVRPGEFRFNVAAQASSAIERERRLVDLQATLAELRARSSAPDDPEVKKVEARIQDVQKALAQAPRVDLFSGEFDMTKTTLFTGKVSQVQWINPRAWLTVETSGGTYRVQLAAPNTMVRSGMNRNTFQLEMEVTVTGALAKDGSMTVQAATILSGGTPIFSRATIAPVPDAQ
jgi:tetratricopeptide (TPR) repeat protein